MRGSYVITLLDNNQALLEQISANDEVITSKTVSCFHVEINCDGVYFNVDRKQFRFHGLLSCTSNGVIIFDY